MPDETKTLTPNQETVMQYYAGCVGRGWVMPFDNIANGTGLSRTAAKRAARQLARMGCLELSTGFNEDDGLIAGRGYALTKKGETLLAARTQGDGR